MRIVMNQEYKKFPPEAFPAVKEKGNHGYQKHALHLWSTFMRTTNTSVCADFLITLSDECISESFTI